MHLSTTYLHVYTYRYTCIYNCANVYLYLYIYISSVHAYLYDVPDVPAKVHNCFQENTMSLGGAWEGRGSANPTESPNPCNPLTPNPQP